MRVPANACPWARRVCLRGASGSGSNGRWELSQRMRPLSATPRSAPPYAPLSGSGDCAGPWHNALRQAKPSWGWRPMQDGNTLGGITIG